MASFNDHKTTVTVQRTNIKMVNEVDDVIYTITVNGKLNIIDSKAFVEDKMGYTYISKENVKHTFNVLTNDLINLAVEPVRDDYRNVVDYSNAKDEYESFLELNHLDGSRAKLIYKD